MRILSSFVLAPNKDLAVSLLYYYRIFPEGNTNLFKLVRRCSHLAHYCGRLLAATILTSQRRVGVRTFLCSRNLEQQSFTLLIQNYNNKYFIIMSNFKEIKNRLDAKHQKRSEVKNNRRKVLFRRYFSSFSTS